MHGDPNNPTPNADTALAQSRRDTLAGLGLISVGVLLAGARSAEAGPLNPPAGPVTSTGKATQEIYDKIAAIEPRTAINAANTPGDATSLFRITQPGSYYLAGNITGVAGKNGISIAASGVTLDLNGFSLAGVAGANTGLVATVSGLTNIAVLNGSVRNWASGVDLSLATNCRVEGVLVSGNSNDGIFIGNGSAVTNCSVNGNGSGITAGDGSTVTGCSADANFYGIVLIGALGADCTVKGNSESGIVCSSACVVRDNTCSGNGSGVTGAGILVSGNDNRIEGNSVTGNSRGIALDAGVNGNIVIRNHASRNTGTISNNYIYPASGNFIGTVITSSAGMNAASNALVNTSY